MSRPPVGFGASATTPDPALLPGTRAGPLLRLLDLGLTRTTEMVAALLVVGEVVLLGFTTTARYVFGHPFPWSDEAATLLFIWLAVLGAVVALQRGEHMRLTALVRGMSPRSRAWLDAVAMMLVAAVLLSLLEPAWEHYDELSDGLSPVMQISEGFRGGAVLVGLILMLLTAIQTLLRAAKWTQVAAALLVVGAAVAVLN